MKKRIIAALASMTFVLAASAQALPSLLIGSDPVAAGVGGAALARAADGFAVENNAAAMALSGKDFAVGASYGMWAPGTADNMLAGLGVWYRLGKGLAVGLSGKMLQDKPYELSSPTGQVSGTFTPSDMMGGLGLSYSISDDLAIGVTGRFVSSTIAQDMKGSAFGADISAMYKHGALSAAAGVANLGSKISYGGAAYALPAMVKAGAAYSVAGLTASAELDWLFSGALMAALGAEYCIADIVSLRAGYHYGDAARAVPSYASLGLGAAFAGFSLDLAFLTASETIGNTIVFGAGFTF